MFGKYTEYCKYYRKALENMLDLHPALNATIFYFLQVWYQIISMRFQEVNEAFQAQFP